MKTTILFLMVGFLCYQFYHIGRNKGFNDGWNYGFIRGLENSEYREPKIIMPKHHHKKR